MTDRYSPENARLPRLNPRTGERWKPGKDRTALIFPAAQSDPLEISCRRVRVDGSGRLVCLGAKGEWVATFSRDAWAFWRFRDVTPEVETGQAPHGMSEPLG